MTFFYLSGKSGMTSTGSFTKDKSRWMVFEQSEKERIESSASKPYGATKQGKFQPVGESLLEQFFKPDLTLILDKDSKITGIKPNTTAGSSFVLQYAGALLEADYNKLFFKDICVETIQGENDVQGS